MKKAASKRGRRARKRSRLPTHDECCSSTELTTHVIVALVSSTHSPTGVTSWSMSANVMARSDTDMEPMPLQVQLSVDVQSSVGESCHPRAPVTCARLATTILSTSCCR